MWSVTSRPVEDLHDRGRPAEARAHAQEQAAFPAGHDALGEQVVQARDLVARAQVADAPAPGPRGVLQFEAERVEEVGLDPAAAEARRDEPVDVRQLYVGVGQRAVDGLAL